MNEFNGDGDEILRLERVWVWERYHRGWRERERVRDRESLEMFQNLMTDEVKEKEKRIKVKEKEKELKR